MEKERDYYKAECDSLQDMMRKRLIAPSSPPKKKGGSSGGGKGGKGGKVINSKSFHFLPTGHN